MMNVSRSNTMFNLRTIGQTILRSPIALLVFFPLYSLSAFLLVGYYPVLGVVTLATLFGISILFLPKWIHQQQLESNTAKLYCYLLLLFQSFFFMAAIWHWRVEDVYYYCADHAPFFNFFPPFIHSSELDYYIASEQFVYSLWLGFCAMILLLPFLAMWFKSSYFSSNNVK